jgi:hypothetical protein
VFRNEKDTNNYNLGAFLTNGKLKIIDSEDTTDSSLWKATELDLKVEGEILQMVSD